MSQLSLKIEGMSCGHCVAAVSKALRQLPGVTVEDVKVGAARVTYDEAAVRPEQITQAVDAAGYTASEDRRS